MLSRKLCSFYRKRMCLNVSTLPAQNSDAVQPVDFNAGINSETRAKKFMSNVLEVPDYFNVANLFTVKDLFNARVHYGHKTTSVHPKMSKFIFGSRLGHSIFDLDKTAFHLKEALNFTAHIAYLNGIILFISRNPRATLLVENTALECKEFAITREWALGTFTDAENKFGCAIRLPDLIIIFNTLLENGHEHMAVVEAAKMCLPTVGIVDSNCDPSLITYPVPGNDDSYCAIQLYCKLFKEAILRGKNERKNHLKMLKSEKEDINQVLKENENTDNTDENSDNKKS